MTDEVKGIIISGDKYIDLETGDELEVQTHTHATYGDVKYLNYNHKALCSTCEGTGLVGEVDCTDCVDGEVDATELVVEHSYENPEGALDLPSDWHDGGGS